MPTTNEALFDAANRNQIFLIRYGGSSAREAIKLLDKAEIDLVERIAKRVDRLGPAASATLGSKRLKSILKSIREQNRDLVNALYTSTSQNLRGLAVQEIGIADRRIVEAVGVELNNFKPTPEEIRTLVEKRAVGAKTLRSWFTRLGNDRLGRLESAVNLGVLEGDTIGDMVRRFRASEAVTRRSAETLVRTHVNHVANQARAQLYAANADIVDRLRWTATLDGRTSPICQARDGKTYPLSEGPRPPAHPNCRSIMTPVLKSWKELAKPGAFKQGRGASDIDSLFKKKLRKQGLKPVEIQRIKRNTRASMNGQVPGDLNYQDWLGRQPEGFQNEVLGKTRGRLFRDGNLRLDRFVDDATGGTLTLDQIRQANEKSWMEVVSGVPQSQTKLWDATTEVGNLHEGSFIDAPLFLKSQVGALKKLHVIDATKEGAYYSSEFKGIHMGIPEKGLLKRRIEGTWRHEVGHAIDHQLGVGPTYASSLEMVKPMARESKLLQKKSSGLGKLHLDDKRISRKGLQANQELVWERYHEIQREQGALWKEGLALEENIVIQRKLLRGKFNKFGIALEDVENALIADDGYSTFIDSKNLLTKVLVSLERKDAAFMVNEVLDWNKWFTKGNSGKVADYFGAITRNRIGYGHSTKYYKRASYLAPTETFANAVVFLADKNPFWAQYLRNLTPETMAAAEKILKNV